MENNKKLYYFLGIGLVVGLLVGYFGTQSFAYNKGYKQAETDAKALQEASANKATEDAAKLANPFQSANPLESVESDPFAKTKKILNPFQ